MLGGVTGDNSQQQLSAESCPVVAGFDGRPKIHNILPQQKIAKSCDRAPCNTGQLSAQQTLRGKLLLRAVPCNITFSNIQTTRAIFLTTKLHSFDLT